jgi:glycerophosphoryl diester phosphodiesterase
MWPYPKIIAHRGGGSLAPENTLAAFECGFNHGFRAVEFDVMLTKDLIPVVVHDEELGRTIAGEGLICDTLAADLVQMDAGSWFGAEFAHCRVPLYQEVLDFCSQRGIWMNVEIKPATGFEQITGQIVAQFTSDFYQHKSAQLPLFSSFSLTAIAAARATAAHIPRGVLFDQIPIDWLTHMRELEAITLHTNQRHLSQLVAEQIQRAGYGLSCYTVNEISRAQELLAWGVDALFTDRLTLIGPDFA